MTVDLAALRAEYDARVQPWAKDVLLFGLRGSHAHGTYLPPDDPNGVDDVDVFAVYTREPAWYLSLDAYSGKQQDVETAGEHLDICAYEVRKFLHLLEKGNPNVHSWLWTEGVDASADGQHLIRLRQELLSKRLFSSLAGYATSQIKKMLQGHTQGYMGAKRKDLLRLHGYDIKDASHCIRLLYQGIHLARTGELRVAVTGEQREHVIAIKTGQWTLDRVQQMAGELFAEFRGAEPLSQLPDAPARATLDSALRLAVGFSDWTPLLGAPRVTSLGGA